MQPRHYSDTAAGQNFVTRIVARWRTFLDSDFLWLF